VLTGFESDVKKARKHRTSHQRIVATSIRSCPRAIQDRTANRENIRRPLWALDG